MAFKKILCLSILSLGSYWAALGQAVLLRESEKGIDFFLGEVKILTYQTVKEPVPEGVMNSFSKSGFIHPINSPSGHVLSRIQPADHYHHYGIWGPWTRAIINGREVDFWNLGDEKGRVDFSHIISKNIKDGRAELTVRQNHLDLLAPESKRIALEEDLQIAVQAIDHNRYLVDYSTTIFTQISAGVLLDAYRYGGGIAFRARESWGDETSEILTSEAHSRETADGTKAKWIMVNGKTDSPEGTSGLLFLSHVDNRAHPEPLRVWPPGEYQGRGNVFFEFTPIRYDSWLILPQKRYTLKYRIVVFDGELSTEEADFYWKEFIQ